MATAVVNGIRMHYRRIGEGSPIVLLHGWPQTGYAWRHVADDLAADQHRDRARSAWLRPQ
jgi:pimeloyl-ACP methyl ester carboxylesterase